MSDTRRIRARLGLLKGSLALPLSVLIAFTAVLPPSGAAAQERPRTVMEMLFGNSSRQAAPPRRVERRQRGSSAQQQRRGTRNREAARERRSNGRQQQTSRRGGRSAPRAAAAAAAAAATAAPAAPAAVDKAPDARKVLVVGDFLAASLAKGLTRSFATDANVVVEERSNGSSGLVRTDHYDWLGELKPMLETTKPAALVVMLGANDRQPISLGSASYALRTDEWSTAYDQRVATLAATAKQAGVPVVWVGMPSFKFDRMSEDMVFLNDIYRKNSATISGEFVDVWDGFVDANGAFTYSGPDVAGQPAQLRNSDGITMTPAGEDKLAFFARRPLEKILGKSLVASASPDGMQGPGMPGGIVPPAAPIDLGAPVPEGPDDLLGATPPASARTASAETGPQTPGATPLDSPRDLLVVAGTPAPGAEGRADNFQWDDKGPAVAPPGNSGPAPITASGSLDLAPLRSTAGPTPPPEMPSLEDAIINEWQRESEAARQPGSPTPGQ